MPYKDPLKNKECQRLHHLKNKEKYRKMNRENYIKNKERYSLRAKIYREKNKEQLRIKKRESWYIRNYGITVEERQRMIQSQDNKCMICGDTLKESKNIHIDHDHATGKTRDVLCDLCNGGLGLFKDNIKTLQEAINYLIKWGKL